MSRISFVCCAENWNIAIERRYKGKIKEKLFFRGGNTIYILSKVKIKNFYKDSIQTF